MINNWKRAGIAACTAAALAVGAGLAFGPAAMAAPAANPLGSTTTLVNRVVGGTTTVANGALGGTTTAVNGLLGGGTSGTTSGGSTTPIITTTGGGIDVNLGGTTVGVTTGNGLGAGVTTGGAPVVGVQLGGTTSGATGTVTVGSGEGGGTGGGGGTDGRGGTDGGGTSAPSGDPSSASNPSSGSSSTGSSTAPATPVMLTALSVVSQYSTVYPAKDGYRDSTAFQLNGTATDGQQHAASGVLSLKFGSSIVRTWPITATNQVISWNGLQGSKIVPGAYTVTATIGDADGHQVSGTDRVVVSPKKLATTSQLLTIKAVSGTHTMAAKPRAGLQRGKVTLRITSVASKVKGKQYLVLKHAGKSIKVRIRNGKHTSQTVTIPKSFTTYTISHTWKKGTVKIKSLKYKYTYRVLK